MVSIRRKTTQSTAVGHRPTNFFCGCSIWTFRNFLLAFIVLQSLNLSVRVLQRISTIPTASTTDPTGDIISTSTILLQQQERLERDGAFEFVKNNENEAHVDAKKKDDITDATPDDDKAGNGDQGGDAVDDKEEEEGGGGDDKDDVDEVERESEGGGEGEEQQADDPDSNRIKEEQEKKEVAVEPAGATAAGYVVDLEQMRLQPDFRRHQNTLLSSMFAVDGAGATTNRVSVVSQLTGGVPLKPCDYVSAQSSTSSSSDRLLLLQRAVCRNDPSTHLIAYNPASFPRYVCGRAIPAKGVLKLDKFCKESVRLFQFQEQAGVSGGGGGGIFEGTPPIVVKSYSSMNSNPELEAVECNVPCLFEQGLPTKGERTIDGTSWKLIVNDADAFFDDNAKVELTAFKRDEYYSTVSLTSSVPLSLYSFDLYNLRNRPPIDRNEAENAATYILDTGCNIPGGLRRHKWYAAMSAAFPTRSYGVCEHNADVMPGGEESTSTLEGRVALAKRNRIILAFEASGDKDYATAIVWESLLSGAVPALLGARNAKDFLPKNSAILASNFNNWDAYAAHVKSVSENQTLWESYHAWRADETELGKFEERFNFTRTSPQCRTCRWAYSKLYGLGWNHKQQQLQETHIPRRLCWSSSRSSPLVVRPFREAWGRSSVVESSSTTEACQTTETTTARVEIDGYKVERSVMQHDGVVDLVIHSVEVMSPAPTTDLILRFHVDVRNFEGAYFPHSHTLATTMRGALCSSATIQDENAKVSVLASWETQIRSPGQGVIEVVVLKQGDQLHADETRRIRVITEDFNVIHDKLTEYFPSSFAKQMTIDFIDPVELYYED